MAANIILKLMKYTAGDMRVPTIMSAAAGWRHESTYHHVSSCWMETGEYLPSCQQLLGGDMRVPTIMSAAAGWRHESTYHHVSSSWVET